MIQTTKVKINQVKENPDNPRVIKDKKYQKLLESIKKFPKMLEVRPIVVDENMMVLGGNMRLKACREAGLKEIAVKKLSDFTEEEKEQFIIKDNVSFGEWDWEVLANQWDNEALSDWGAVDYDTAFEPEFTPSTDTSAVTDEDVTNAEITEKQFEGSTKVMMFTCPHCGEESEIRI